MNKTRLLPLSGLVLSVISLSSCGTGPLVQGPPTPHQAPFREADFALARRSGSASVSGQLRIKFTDGTVMHGIHARAYLMPKTPYTVEIVNREFIHRENLAPPGPPPSPYVRSTMTDEGGNFAFHDVAAGDYIVCGVVDWKDSEEFLDENGSTSTAISWWTNHQWAWEHIKVGRGQTLHVTVTQ